MKQQVKRLLCTAMAAAMILAVGCGGTAQPSSAAPAPSGGEASGASDAGTAADVVKIGVVEPLSGKDALNGEHMRHAFTFAVDKINAAGGIQSMGGAKLELVWGDHQSKQDVAMSEVERLINTEKVSVLAGAELSGITMAATQVAERMQVPFVVDVPAAAAITERGFKYTFRTNISALEYANTFAEYVNYVNEKYDQNIQNVAMYYEDAEIGQSIMTAAREKIAENGWNVVYDQAHLSGIQDAVTHATKIKASNPDALLMNDTGADSIIVTKGLASVGVQPKMIITADGGYEMPYWKENAGATGNDWFQMIQYNGDLPGMAELDAEFFAASGEHLNGHSALGIQVVYVIKEALESAASSDPNAIRDALANLVIEKGSESLIMPWEKVDFDENGQNVGAINIVCQWQGDTFCTVYPEEFATVEPHIPAQYFK